MKNKIQQKIYAIYQTLKAYASKLRISSFVTGDTGIGETILKMLFYKKKKNYMNNLKNDIRDNKMRFWHISDT